MRYELLHLFLSVRLYSLVITKDICWGYLPTYRSLVAKYIDLQATCTGKPVLVAMLLIPKTDNYIEMYLY